MGRSKQWIKKIILSEVITIVVFRKYYKRHQIMKGKAWLAGVVVFSSHLSQSSGHPEVPVVFHSPSKQIPGYYFDLRIIASFLIPSNYVFYIYLLTCKPIVPDTASVGGKHKGGTWEIRNIYKILVRQHEQSTWKQSERILNKWCVKLLIGFLWLR